MNFVLGIIALSPIYYLYTINMCINNYYERLRNLVNEPLKYFSSTSPRKLFFSINLVVTALSLGLFGFSIVLFSLLPDPRIILAWIVWLGLGVVGFGLTITCIVGLRGAHLVSLEHLLTYFWGIIVFIAPLVVSTVASFKFSLSVEKWVNHYWDQPSFDHMRELFCSPLATANNKCMAPIGGDAKHPSTILWCQAYHNATDCQSIRENAIASGISMGKFLSLTQAAVCIANVLLIIWCVIIVRGILTSPVITQSMNDVINYLLVIPIAGCIVIAAYLLDISKFQTTYIWFSYYFVALAISQVVALPIGIFAGRYKNKPMLSCYIIIVFLISSGLAVAGCYGLIFASSLPETFASSETEISDFACNRGLPGCSFCDLPSESIINRCPQWKRAEIIDVIVTDLQISGTVAFACMLYPIGALIVGSIVMQNLKNYKFDFI